MLPVGGGGGGGARGGGLRKQRGPGERRVLDSDEKPACWCSSYLKAFHFTSDRGAVKSSGHLFLTHELSVDDLNTFESTPVPLTGVFLTC